jgi:hypothetical protein
VHRRASQILPTILMQTALSAEIYSAYKEYEEKELIKKKKIIEVVTTFVHSVRTSFN